MMEEYLNSAEAAPKSHVMLNRYIKEYFSKFLDDDYINEICYNGGDKIFCEDVRGEWIASDTQFAFKQALSFAEAMASFKKDEIEREKPILSCILPTGERVQIVIPPATKDGIVSITIRKPSKVRYYLKDYIQNGSIDEHTAEKFSQAVTNGKNLVICGETGSGKTTFMKTLIDFIPKEERVITIEDVEEIKFYEHQNVVQMFYPSEAKSTDLLSPASLLKSCLRMKPSRILLAELRGAETFDFLNVISSGHNGSMTSLHAGSVESAYNRLIMMAMQNETAQKVGKEVISDIIQNTIDLVVVFKVVNHKRQVTEYKYGGVMYRNDGSGKFVAAGKSNE